MLAVAGRDEQWCAVCAACDGSLELRVGPPPRRGLLRRRGERGAAWLREHGFAEIVDAWALPVPPGASEARCAAALEAALAGALGAEPGSPLRHVLTQPGVLDGTAAPPEGAPVEQHLATALRALAAAGRGRLHIESGRPATLRAFVRALDGELLVEREVAGVAGSPGETWSAPRTAEGAGQAAAELARRVRAERAGADSEPWLLAYLEP
jgi:hypothetical protein